MKFIDRTGHRYGRLVVLGVSGKEANKIKWRCICDCGNITELTTITRTKSCGCLQRNTMKDKQYKHGYTKTSEYRIWSGIKSRCYNKKEKCYKNYGGRGIEMCEEWKSNFESFLKDMGLRPSKNHSIDRIDNNKGYFPGNCRWVTSDVQSYNKRNTRYLTIDGKTKTLEEFSKEYNIDKRRVNYRLSIGWSEEDAIKRPLRIWPSKQLSATTADNL